VFQIRTKRYGQKKNLSMLEPNSGRPARSMSLYQLSYSNFLHKVESLKYAKQWPIEEKELAGSKISRLAIA
jgi:hypothetical protein